MFIVVTKISPSKALVKTHVNVDNILSFYNYREKTRIEFALATDERVVSISVKETPEEIMSLINALK